ncbi:MAG TPA: ATP-binding protein [Actinocrinis sp.]
MKRILITEVPADYIKIASGLGESSPASVVILPVLFEDQVLGVIELASFSRFSDVHLAFFDKFVVTIGVAINTVIADSRTEALLSESQRLAQELQERSNELQRQQAELQRSNAALEEKAHLLATSSRYKSEFLANMSHELRTPLDSLLILARLLADNPEDRLSAQDVEFATTIYQSGRDLLQLINDILDLSKVEAGRMDVRPQSLELAKLLDYVDATFRPLTIDRGLTLEVEVGKGVPKTLFADERRIQQILRNLLSNAVKFTSVGEVRLQVERVEGVEVEFEQEALRGEDVLAFTVRDTGIGIPPDKLDVIFEAFRQADGTTSRKYGGTGLGLSICREIARLLGGEIHASSEVGVGSTFTFYVPRRYTGPVPGGDDGPEGPPGALSPYGSDSAAEGVESAESPGVLVRSAPSADADSPGHGSSEWLGFGSSLTDASWNALERLSDLQAGRVGRVLSQRRVLIVDDDIRNVYALTHVLGRLGMEISYAENGREGIEFLLGREAVDVVLMDVMMPEMDGYQTLVEVRRHQRFESLPIIALTAKAMPGDREQTIACGASDYVPKPVDLNYLLDVMCKWLGGERSTD